MRAFLWLGIKLVSDKVKVAWKDLCLSKIDGGLGICPFKVWNYSLMVHHF